MVIKNLPANIPEVFLRNLLQQVNGFIPLFRRSGCQEADYVAVVSS